MFAVMWGTITIVLLLAFGEGLKQSLVAGIVNAGDRILMVYGGQTSLNFEGMSKGRPIRLTEDDMLLIKQSLSREVEAVSPSYGDRKSTRLNSSHVAISYAVFCLKKKINHKSKR